MLLDNDEPMSHEETMMGPDSNKWLGAMKSEIGSMYENKVWTLVDLPDDQQATENKWIFKKKIDADCNVTVCKAQLVAKGFRQVQGVDYDETFSPVAMLNVVTRPEWVKSPCLRVIPGSVCWHTQYSRIYNRGKSHV